MRKAVTLTNRVYLALNVKGITKNKTALLNVILVNHWNVKQRPVLLNRSVMSLVNYVRRKAIWPRIAQKTKTRHHLAPRAR